MVFYRKYRPQNIEELDTLWIRQNLGAVLSSGKVPHAFLFTGPRGLGKTSAARIVAKSVNCLKGEKGAICGKCVVCQSIAAGTNVDILEIDAASNRGIDEIRDLREKIKFSPSNLRFKVYIIDEVHMLTTEAFNALLKTLEEPPAHAIFVLCTTEAHKLPPTITSRCLRFDFKRASRDDLVRSLERIVKGEKLKVKKEVLEEIARGADGSFRDAAKILEQGAFSAGEITKEQIKEILGETQNLKPEELLKLLSKKDVRGAILEVSRLMEAGENLRVYTEKILNLLHQILMAKVGVEGEEEVRELADLVEKEQVVKLITLFSRAYTELKTAVIPQLPLELAVVEYCEMTAGLLKSGVGSDKFSNEVAGPVMKEAALRSSPAISSASDSARKSACGESRAKLAKSLYPVNEVLRGRKGSTQKSGDFLQGEPSGRAPRRLVDSNLSQLWPQIIEVTKEYNHTLAGVLRGCRPQDFDGKILTIETFYQFHKDRLDEPKVRELLDKALVRVFEKKVAYKCILGEKVKKIER